MKGQACDSIDVGQAEADADLVGAQACVGGRTKPDSLRSITSLRLAVAPEAETTVLL
jgi:hypothetical protein